MAIQPLIKNVFEKLEKNKKLVLIYEITMAILSLVVLGMLILEYLTKFYEFPFKIIDTFILIVFSVDYFLRLYIAEDKVK